MYTNTDIHIPSWNQPITFFIGKNAAGNFEIIDNANPHDIWFHINDESSAHVIATIPTNPSSKPLNKKQKHQIIKQGAILTKAHSKQKSEKNIEIVYTTINNVEKATPVGTVHIKNAHLITI